MDFQDHGGVGATVTRIVRAGGGVVWRASQSGLEVLVVHRPRYDDWSPPKGKLDIGEHPLAAAVREVAEETGVLGAPQVPLPPVRYLTSEPDVEKVVDYWVMRVIDERGHEPDHEVDVVEWLPVATARARLTYAHDRGLVAAFQALPPIRGVVVLLRHASAGRRSGWPGDDNERPLDDAGRRDAERAAELVALFAPSRVVSPPPVRCRQTVSPVADRVGVPVEEDPRFAEEADVDGALEALRELAASAPAAVVCSQGGLMRPLVARLRGENGGGEGIETPKGAGW
jgi:8-oxo-dGTP pyrophosphatase MutT (NUDIX family)